MECPHLSPRSRKLPLSRPPIPEVEGGAARLAPCPRPLLLPMPLREAPPLPLGRNLTCASAPICENFVGGFPLLLVDDPLPRVGIAACPPRPRAALSFLCVLPRKPAPRPRPLPMPVPTPWPACNSPGRGPPASAPDIETGVARPVFATTSSSLPSSSLNSIIFSNSAFSFADDSNTTPPFDLPCESDSRTGSNDWEVADATPLVASGLLHEPEVGRETVWGTVFEVTGAWAGTAVVSTTVRGGDKGTTTGCTAGRPSELLSSSSSCCKATISRRILARTARRPSCS